MGRVNLPERVKLIVGLIAGDPELFSKIDKALEKALKNHIDFDSGIIDFAYTDYYNEEMGPNLKRRFLSFKGHVSLEDIYEVKLKTNSLERRFSEDGHRTVNIDPGYLDLSKLVLFSTKDYTHRIYIAKGIFAEATLFYQNKTFNPWPWTYPDYKTKSYIEIFNHIREIYKADKPLKDA